MTHQELRTAIEQVLGQVSYSPPISVAYCVAVRDALRTSLPDASIDVYHMHRKLVVEARLGGIVCPLQLDL